MQYQKNLLIFLLLIFFLSFSFSTTNVLVTSPNGGEVWNGTKNITWDFNDTVNSQDINFTLYYSTAPANKNFLIARDLNFLNYCSSSLVNQWVNSDINYNVGLPSGVYIGNPYSYNLGSDSYLDYIPQDNNLRTLKWSGSSWSDVTSTFSYDKNIGVKQNDSISVFNLDGKTIKMFGKVNLPPSSVGNFLTYYLSGSSWIQTPDYNIGLGGSPDSSFNLVLTQYNNNNLYMVNYVASGNYVRGYLWSGSNWTTDNNISEDFFAGSIDVVRSFTGFTLNDTNRLLMTIGTGQIKGYSWTGVKYSIDADSNYGLPASTGNTRRFISNTINSKLIILSSNGGTDINRTFERRNSYSTSTNASCSYSWDTTNVANSSWFIDINAVGSSNRLDSSNASFRILNFNSTYFYATPISNINNISYDSNAIYLTVGDGMKESIFKVVNNQASTQTAVLSLVNTSLTYNQQYSIFTSSDGVNWVFNDSLTYGESATFNDPVQKILSGSTYISSFSDTFLPNSSKYYKVVVTTLPLAWERIGNSSDWINFNEAGVYTDTNNKKWDLFSDSNYTPIRSVSYKFYPDLTSSDLNTGFEFQFTAYSNISRQLKVGYTIDGTDFTSTINLTTEKRRYSIPVDPTDLNAQFLIKSDGNSSSVYITDYAILPKAYFINRLDLFNFDGSKLQSIIVNGVSTEYLREALPFIINTGAFDRDGNLQRLVITSTIDGTNIKNQEFYLKDSTKANNTIYWNEVIEGFIDFNGNAVYPSGLRNIYIKATLYDNANKSVSEQTKTVKILQYPYFENDIILNLSSLTAKVGENPSFRLNLEQRDPSKLLGIKFLIFDENHSQTNPNYSEIVYQKDLGCNTFICTKTLTFNGFVYEEETNYKIGVKLILSTEAESFTNPLTYKVYNQFVTWRAFETARIFQVFERTDHTYRNDEKIQLVIQLRDVPYRSLGADISTYIQMDLCNADTGACYETGDTKFYAKKFIYDPATGYNYYFFDQLFYSDSGSLFPDGNYVRISATISDKQSAHDSTTIPLVSLADKCASASYGTLFNDGWFNMNFWDNLYSASERLAYGCGTLTSTVVRIGDAEEKRLLIDADHNVQGGQNQSIGCLKIDNNNFQNTLEQDLVCGVLWTRNEQSIDAIKITIGNEFSDYAKDTITGQYLTFEIPAEQLIFNDAFMLQQSLNSEYSTDSIDTVGEIMFYGLDKLFSGVANPVSDIFEGTAKAGLITNIGFDFNFTNTLDPTYVKGIFFFRVKGLKVVNQYDYINKFPELETTNPKFFRDFMTLKKQKIPNETTLINVYSNDLKNVSLVGDQFDSVEVASPLVIYAKPSYLQTSADINQIVVATKLKFDLTSDFISNNYSSNNRVFLPLTFSYIVPMKGGTDGVIDDILYGRDAFGNEAGLLTNPVGFGLKNWFWFLIIICLLLVVSLIMKNFRSGGGEMFIPVLTPFLDNMASKQYHDSKKRR